ncbi:phosphoribosylamine--glycine ligase [Dinghuibacter silviterrae]|uniref:Phosphoribosylamine--glycine ligase n=1 Tax=Dinghuibacter silviterrae TaxID=1539049 RepID=A0A4R8DSH7_9BACT|nr:phosphoribosylamine--glycine ligase [Dinghuibacter silviterrae]TDX00111.1 phosphoribosylamine--glycine ligase [Dinghuibacter silviterrae]
MNILLLGSGGREHALAWKLAQSPRCSRLYIAPGNAGTATCGENVPLEATDAKGLKEFSVRQKIDMVVVGPEEPLVKGVYDAFKNDPSVQHIPVIGPSAEGAQLEGSKAFAKAFMQRHGIPTAAYKEFDDMAAAEAYIENHPLPVVIKADGLAAGKGVIIAQTKEEAKNALASMLVSAEFGAAGARVVIEAFLEGIELSVFVLTDGRSYRILPEAKDYKRIGEGDTGPNTGGMGAVSPVPFATPAFMKKVVEKVVEPTVNGLLAEKIDYKGFIFLGLINVGGEPFVIEYNCRLGDPETEVVLPRLRNDLVDLLEAVAGERLDEVRLDIDPRTAVTTVAVSEGYPGAYPKGRPIDGLPLSTGSAADVLVFQAGTTPRDGKVLTNGGRVLAVTAFGDTVTQAKTLSREALKNIRFEGMYFRKDIGYEFQ